MCVTWLTNQSYDPKRENVERRNKLETRITKGEQQGGGLE